MRMFRPSVQPHAGRPSLLGRRRLHIEPLESRQLLSVIPITVSTGPITVQETRTSYNATYDEIDVHLTGMTVADAKIVDIDGTWTATGGAFYLTGSFPADTLDGQTSSPVAIPAARIVRQL